MIEDIVVNAQCAGCGYAVRKSEYCLILVFLYVVLVNPYDKKKDYCLQGFL